MLRQFCRDERPLFDLHRVKDDCVTCDGRFAVRVSQNPAFADW